MALREVIKTSIHQIIGDAIHETAYRPIDNLTHYNRNILWNTAKSQNHTAYSKRLEYDPEFWKVLSRVVCGNYLLRRSDS
jgi:hypothetical protein